MRRIAWRCAAVRGGAGAAERPLGWERGTRPVTEPEGGDARLWGTAKYRRNTPHRITTNTRFDMSTSSNNKEPEPSR